MRELEIDGRRIADDTPCFVIAEIGHNHQGSVEKAQELFVLAKQAGVDAVKLQKRDNRRLFTRALYDSAYDNENSFGPTYGAHREALELDRGAFVELQACARELGLVFFATAFDEASADLLSELDVPAYKIASGDLRNTPLLRHVAAIGKPLIVSTGGATIEDVDRAVETVTAINPQLCLLQCTASYPASVEELELGVIATYRERYPELVVGLSDHQDGIAMAPVAYMLGARVIEKHFTVEPHGEGHRPRVLPHAGGDAEARPRSPPCPRRDRRRRQAAAPERGGAAAEDGEAARRGASAPGGSRARRGRPRREVACRGWPAAVPARRPRRHEASARAPGGRGGAHDRRRDRRCPRGGVVDGDVSDPLFDLAGRVAVVTGGMGQLGAELSVALASRGMRVAILDLETTPRAGTPGLATALEEGTVRAHACDVTDRAQVESALALVEADWGVPDLLVNAAAIDAPPDAPAAEVGPFEDVPVESLERVVHVNVLGVVVPCQVIGGAMARAGRGSIVNVGSVYGLLSPDQGLYDFRREAGEAFYKPVAYSVSKSALVNLTRYLATYWGRSGVRVNTLTPHGIENGQPAPFVEAFAARSPLGRLMDVSEAVGAVVFLASDASSYVTGANLVVDGGWSAW